MAGIGRRLLRRRRNKFLLLNLLSTPAFRCVNAMAVPRKLPMIADPVTGQKPEAPSSSTDADTRRPWRTIHDPPTSILHDGTELCMVVPVDPELGNVLLRIPNDLGWRYHFGCRAAAVVADDDRRNDDDHGNGGGDEDATTNGARRALSNALLCAPGQLVLREAGVMLFTFQNGVHRPMRVTVYVSNVPFDPHGGEYYDFEDVPFHEMWADDKIWMPSLLENAGTECFELHCIFDGLPGKDAALIDYAYEAYKEMA